MRRKCAWCGLSVGAKEPLDNEETTHGICLGCGTQILALVDGRPRRVPERSAGDAPPTFRALSSTRLTSVGYGGQDVGTRHETHGPILIVHDDNAVNMSIGHHPGQVADRRVR
jgi:hypothetical protein